MEGAASSGTHGRYRVLRRLGVGGMAETFVAEREGPGGFVQRVCLKRILPAFANDAEFVRLFLQEARLAARLRHNNVVGVLDFGKEESGYFLALELIEGVDLRKLLRSLPEGRLPVPIAVLVAGDVALALEYAHGLAGEGIVHRDISPSNILLSKAGEVKLGDFGIAKAMQGAGATATNSLKGKIPYMAPEQMQMTDIDGRADLFALGVVLFEMLAGKRPFDGATDVQTMTRIMQGQREPIRRLRPDVPPPLARVVDRLLQPDRERRFRDAGELLDALSPLLPSAATRRQLARMVGEAEQHADEEPAAPEVTGARAGSQAADEPRSVSAIRHARAEQPTSTAAERPASKRPQAPDALPTEAEAAPTVADISGAPTLAMEGVELPGPGDHAGASFEPEQAAPDEATRTRLPVGGQPEPGAASHGARGDQQPARSRSVTPTPARVRNRKATLPLQALVGEAGAEAHEAAVERAAAEEAAGTRPADGDAASPASPQQRASTVEVDPALHEQTMASEPETATDVLPVTAATPRRSTGLPLGALLAAALGLLVVLGGGAWWLLAGGDRADQGQPVASEEPKSARSTAQRADERGTPAAVQNEAKPTPRQAGADSEQPEGSSAAGMVAAGEAPPADVGGGSETAANDEGAATEEGASTKAPEPRASTSRRSNHKRRGAQRRQTDRTSQRTTDTAATEQATRAAGTTAASATPSQAGAGQQQASEASRPDTSQRSGDRRYRTVGRIPAGAPTGKLEVRCIPWGDVWIDGVPMGRSPVFARVRAGSRRVECGLGARRVTRTTRVSAGSRRRLEITMGGS